jgi:Ni/Co efflux regulator RcnB
MKRLVSIILALAAAAAISAPAAASAGTFVTMRDFTTPGDTAYDRMVLDLARKKAQSTTCRADSCPARIKDWAGVGEGKAKPVPFFGGLKLLPR